MDLSDAIKEAYEHAPAEATYFDTLEIQHSSFLETIKIVRSFQILSTNQGDFSPCLFDFTLPETEGAVRGQMDITINFLPKEAQIKLLSATQTSDPVRVKYRQYLGGELDPDAELPVVLTLANIEQTHQGVTATALFPDLTNIIFPRRLMTTTALPGGII